MYSSVSVHVWLVDLEQPIASTASEKPFALVATTEHGNICTIAEVFYDSALSGSCFIDISGQ